MTVTPREFVKGVVGLTKIALQIDLVDEPTIKARRDVCRRCEYSTKNKERLNTPSLGLTNKSMCTECKCFIMGKSQLKQEECPKNKWAILTI
jgi:hypothetical protein